MQVLHPASEEGQDEEGGEESSEDYDFGDTKPRRGPESDCQGRSAADPASAETVRGRLTGWKDTLTLH